jgi:hypothetical protein
MATRPVREVAIIVTARSAQTSLGHKNYPAKGEARPKRFARDIPNLAGGDKAIWVNRHQDASAIIANY